MFSISGFSKFEMLLALDDDQHTLKAVPQAIYSAPLDGQLIDASVRLLEALEVPASAVFPDIAHT